MAEGMESMSSGKGGFEQRAGSGGGGGGGRGARERIVLPLDKLFDKPPPHSLLAEMALLGAMILDPG